MVERSAGTRKLTPDVQQRLAEMADEARHLVYGKAGCPTWGTLFAEIEDDAKEVGHEFTRLVMQQTAEQQAEGVLDEASITDIGEVAQSIGTEERTIETESGEVDWDEPKAYLPKSRNAFSPPSKALGWAPRVRRPERLYRKGRTDIRRLVANQRECASYGSRSLFWAWQSQNQRRIRSRGASKPRW